MFADGIRTALNPTAESRKGPPPQMPKLVVVLGMQSGDVGVEALVRHLAPEADVVCRCQGGEQWAMGGVVTDGAAGHIMPYGMRNPKSICVIGNGMAIDVESMLFETMFRGRNNKVLLT